MKYPKLLLLLATFVAAYVLHRAGVFDVFIEKFNGHGYVSVFLGGLLFSFSFTAAFGFMLLLDVAPHIDPLLAAPIGGIGALLTDLFLFRFVRAMFDAELHRLRSTRVLQWCGSLFHRHDVLRQLRLTLLWSVAGLIIASPLPDEIGVSLLSGVSEVEGRKFAVFCFFVNTLGILAILAGARLVAS